MMNSSMIRDISHLVQLLKATAAIFCCQVVVSHSALIELEPFGATCEINMYTFCLVRASKGIKQIL